MRNFKQLKEKMLSVALAFVLVVSVFVAVPATEAYAAATFEITELDKTEIEVYEGTNCLKSMTLTIKANEHPIEGETWNTAHGRVAVHNAPTNYSYSNRFIDKKNLGENSWPTDSEVKLGSSKSNNKKDTSFIAFAECADGVDFLWTDCEEHEITITFENNVIDLDVDYTYYLYLWTRADKYGIYPDAEIRQLIVEDGALKINGEEISHIHELDVINGECKDGLGCVKTLNGEACWYVPTPALDHNLVTVSGECKDGLACDRDDCNYVEVEALDHHLVTVDGACKDGLACDRDDCDYVDVEALDHDMADATCTAASKCKREGCTHEEGEALGHDFSGEWKVVKEATTKEEGLKETACVNGCGEKKTEKIPVKEAPKTGDMNNLFPMMAAMVAAGAAVVVADKKRREN